MNITEKLTAMTPKSRQLLMLGGAGVVVIALAAMSASFTDDTQAAVAVSSVAQEPTNIVSPGAAADPKEVWMEQSATQMKQMTEVISGLKDQMKNMEDKGDVKNKSPSEFMPELPPLPAIEGGQNATLPFEPEPMKPQEPGIASFEVSQIDPTQAATESAEVSNMAYIPAGTFVRVVLLGGLDAPTGGQAQSNPHPILMRAHDNAFLPNRFRFEIKECFLLASSYGDMSSERAIARLENISCVRNDGTAVDISVKGYVVGEDGKAGMRGRLISKQGQVLANALLAGIGSGIGQAFQSSATTQSVSALGSTSTTTPGQQLQNGISGGVGKALDRLSQYYIDLAEKLFPIIEIDAGRNVEVVFTKGFSMDVNKQDQVGSYSDVWKRTKEVMGDAAKGFDADISNIQN